MKHYTTIYLFKRSFLYLSLKAVSAATPEKAVSAATPEYF